MINSNIKTSTSSLDTSCVSAGVDRADLILAFEKHRARLVRMVQLRLDRRIASRMDPSDVIQEAFIRANSAFDEYQKLKNIPLSAWLRIQTRYAIGDSHRRHLHTQKRSAGHELDFNSPGDCNSYDGAMAPALEQMAESLISPSSVVAKQELLQQVHEIMAQMPEMDREILILRHVEDVSITDAAAELEITVEAAKKRHLRALRRLQTLCEGLDVGHMEPA